MKSELKVTAIQADLIWHNATANCAQLEEWILKAPASDLYVLPEMFSTGFSMESEFLAENMEGPTHQWMKNTARKVQTVVCGSLIISDGERIFNRFLWVDQDGKTTWYDKRHRFTMAGEHYHFSAGNKQVVVELDGWRILLQVCYDLRFPVWSRNQQHYDAAIYVANWPAPRTSAWQKLLPARAIENQCYVVGVNRVGKDGNDISYSGDSAIIDAYGEYLAKADTEKEELITAAFSAEKLEAFRKKFPVLEDGDAFEIKP